MPGIMEGQEEIVREFLSESREGLDRFDQDVVTLEADPSNIEIVARIFRVIHTIKGNSGFLGLVRLQTLAHAGESLLVGLRDGSRVITPAIAGVLLQLGDAVRHMMDDIERDGHEPETDHTQLTLRLAACQQGSPVASPSPGAALAAGMTATTAGVAPPPADDSVRVDVRLLDTLIELSDSLVMVRNRVETIPRHRRDPGLADTALRLDEVTTRLQSEVMQLRMQRMSALWSRFPRMVRDLAASCGKHVTLELSGEELELDRAILEAIRDPLVHLVRNAVDHGIETPDVRVVKGKSAAGRLALRARYAGGQVRIELEDDGRGIDPDAVRRRAIERGFATPDRAARMGPAELTALLFMPGFSTAERVTEVSGRGVGLDVVKTNVEKIGGTVELSNTPGAGTRVTITLPLTLAIMPALMVAAGGGQYAIPLAGVMELVRINPSRDLEWAQTAPVFRRRGELLPVVNLGRLLANAPETAGRATGDEAVHVVVVQAVNRRFGLVVDGVLDTQEIVVKPRSKFLGSEAPFAGSTITGDGGVALILDVVEIARRARLGTGPGAPASSAEPAAPAEMQGAVEPLLVFRSPDEGRMVMPLSLVGRVERLSSASIESVGRLEVVQYLGGVLPLIRVAEVLNERRGTSRHPEPEQTGGTMVVVVLARGDRRVGLVVDRVTDIVHEPLVVDRPAGRDGVLGSAIVGRQVAEVFDVEGAIRSRDPGFFAGEANA